MATNQRPPADVAYSEIFFDEKCGFGGEQERDSFFRWCDNPRATFETKCSNFSGIKGPCDMKLEFLKKDRLPFAPLYVQRALTYVVDVEDVTNRPTTLPTASSTMMHQNSTTPKTDLTTLASPVDEDTPVALKYEYMCDFGEDKGHKFKGVIEFKQSDDYDKIKTYCHQKIYGVNSTPIWLMVLIILLVVAAVTGAAFLFWKYWLKRRVYIKDTSRMSSGVESHWTLGPGVSSAASRVSSVRPASQHSVTRSIRSGSVRSNPERSSSKRASKPLSTSKMRSNGKTSLN